MNNQLFKALADPTRREIIRLLGKGEMTAGDLAERFDMTKPTVSHHFSVLKEAGLIDSRREGQRICYSLNTTVAEDVLAWLWDLFGKKRLVRKERNMTRIYVVASLLIIAAAIGASLALYNQMPEKIPTHWNINGEIDGYGSKQWAAFLLPGMLAVLLLLFAALPWLSPKHFEVDSFKSTYWFIVLVISAALAYIHGLTLWAAVAETPIDITRAMLAGLLIMFGLMGNVLGKVKRNFYVGVKTPWTLVSERVWNDTHRLAARLFVVAAIVGLVALVPLIPLPASGITAFVLIMMASLFPAGYSLWLYKKLERRGELGNGDAAVEK